jgi:hypothetical protein
MPRERKMIYVDFAKQFDMKHATSCKTRVRPVRGVKHTFMVPLIHVVRRSESSAAAEIASLNSLCASLEDSMDTVKA